MTLFENTHFVPVIHVPTDPLRMASFDGWRYHATPSGFPYLVQSRSIEPIIIILVGDAHRRALEAIEKNQITEFNIILNEDYTAFEMNLIEEGKTIGKLSSGPKVKLQLSQPSLLKQALEKPNVVHLTHHIVIRPVEDRIFAFDGSTMALRRSDGMVYGIHNHLYFPFDGMTFRQAFAYLNAPLQKATLSPIQADETGSLAIVFDYQSRSIACFLTELETIPEWTLGMLVATQSCLIDNRKKQNRCLMRID